MAPLSPCLLPQLLLCIAMVTQVASKPSPRRPESEDVYEAEITSLLFTQPAVSDGPVPAQSSTPTWSERHGPLVHDPEAPHAVPRFFLDFLNRQRKLRGRSRKSSARGCFGMKVDRIGALSGLGC